MQLFGLPYVESPTEAEAQCATLESLQLTQGTITDDNISSCLEGTRSIVMSSLLTMTLSCIPLMTYFQFWDLIMNHDKLIVLAYLLGSDYTEGLEGSN